LRPFAFYPNKQITTGEGGILLTDDPDVARLAISLRNQGRSDGSSWLAHTKLGYNYRLDELSCALGIEQLKRIDEIIQKRSNVAQHYQQRLADDDRLIIPAEPADCSMSWFVYVIRLQDQYTAKHRDQILTQLSDEGIGCANYFPPVHLQPFMVERFGYKTGDFPITEKVAQRTIALPFYNNLTEPQIDTVCTTLKKILDNLKP
ncbi:MAG: DegT/DnrJ/EryC1/StrS family aminotransferase, partial [Planctomycetes bacterium]|nr:DegT/DnrJ/EryC1/StrS family aminotransferase [Planctomycetota bacterium]